MIPGMPQPDMNTLFIAIVGLSSLVLGILSWKLGQRKKAKLKPEEEIK